MRWVVAAALAAMMAHPPASAAPQDDAGSGGDAGNTFETATPVTPRGFYSGRLDRAGGDRHDYYRFFLPEAAFVSVLVDFTGATIDPIEMLDPQGNPIDVGTRAGSLGVSAGAVFTTEISEIRLSVHRAHLAGYYRLHLQAERFALGDYTLCFLNCEGTLRAPIEFVFGGALRSTDTRVLLVPPAHGDLGNPFGPTVVDYIQATLRGVHRWTAAMDAFAADEPQYAYLRQIRVHIEVFDGVDPVDPAGYDVIIGYVAAGPAFRGVASDLDPGAIEGVLRQLGLSDEAHFSGRVIALSLFGSSPRAGQVLYDFPEVNDLEIVTTHEFGHTFGLGHTRTWDPVLGPDLMNSPAPFVYGDGFPAGDGGERTARKCLSSLDLYGMAHLYRWVPSGAYRPTSGQISLPTAIPYRLYC